MIEIKNLTKRYGDKLAVNDISFNVNEGEILGFLGPNGAGKSTTMNILTGYLSSNVGQVIIDGVDILENPTKAKKNIGFLPEQPPLYYDMTVKEYLNFIFDLKKSKLNRKEHIGEICELIGIDNVYGRMINNLSKGYKQRVGLAQALIGNPSVLILDEPTVGLDPKQIIEIRNLIKKLGKNRTIILSTHILPEAQTICERIIIINQGKIVADGTTDDIAHNVSDSRRIVLRLSAPVDDAIKVLRNKQGIKSVEVLGTKEPETTDYLLESQPNVDIRKPLFNEMAQKGWPILGLKPMDMTLEDVFISLVTKDASEGREA